VRKPIGKVAVMVGRTPKGQIPLYWKVARIYAPSTYVMDLIKSPRALAVTKVIGYPIEWADHARAAAQTGNPVTIGFVGRVHPEKGIELLLRAAGLLAAMDGLPEWRLRIVGPVAVEAGGGGEAWAASLRAAIPEALARRIEWLGPEFDAARLAQVYGTLDVFCYPSLALGGETFGVAVAEAMAAGGAAVVSDLACFRDLVSDGETGLVFARAEPDAGARLAVLTTPRCQPKSWPISRF
jgi:glycosyltransferase involved in cell wall biosynthesis